MIHNVFFFLTFKKDVSYLYDTMPLSLAIPLLRKEKYSAVPVIGENGQYCGSISEGDFLYALCDGLDDPSSQTVVSDLIRKDYMPACNVSVPFETLVAQALKQNYVPIVDDRNIFIGIVTRRSLLGYFASCSDSSEICKALLSDEMRLEMAA
jgi:CBS domain-containing protein